MHRSKMAGRVVVSLVLCAASSWALTNSLAESGSSPAGAICFDVPAQESRLVSSPLWLTRELALPEGVGVLRWDAASQEYVTPREGYTPQPGEAYWLVNSATQQQRVCLAGYIDTNLAQAIRLPPALSVYGSPYLSALSNHLMGVGYWYLNTTTGAVEWAVARPYALPATVADSAAEIVDVSANAARVTLWIKSATGTVSILTQDLTAESTPNFDVTWSQTQTVGTNDETSWSEDIPPGTYARVYRVLQPGAVGRPAESETAIGLAESENPWSAGVDDGAALVLNEEGLRIDGASTNLAVEQAVEEAGTNSVARMTTLSRREIHVDARRGNDRFSGRSGVIGGLEGPKKTIQAALRTAQVGDTLVVWGGSYQEDMNVAGLSLDIRLEGDVQLSRTARHSAARSIIRTNSMADTQL